MDTNKIVNSPILKKILIGLGMLAVLLVVFALGVRVGYSKASFSYRWGEQYHRNFGGPREGFYGPRGDSMQRPFGPPPEFTDAHGTFGTILKIDQPTEAGKPTVLVISGRDQVEMTVLVSDKTIIRDQRNDVAVGDLQADEGVMVIGDPDDQGQIAAKLIRVFQPFNGQK